MHNEDLVNKGWDDMLVTLDTELPQKENKRRAIIWLWLGMLLLIGLAGVLWFANQESTKGTNQIVASESNATVNENRKIDKKKNINQRNASILTEAITTNDKVEPTTKETEINKNAAVVNQPNGKTKTNTRFQKTASLPQPTSNLVQKSSNFINPSKPLFPKNNLPSQSAFSFEKQNLRMPITTGKKVAVEHSNLRSIINPISTLSNTLWQNRFITSMLNDQQLDFNFEIIEPVKIKADRKNGLYLQSGFVYVPSNRFSGLEFGLTHLFNVPSKFSHGPSVSFLALSLAELGNKSVVFSSDVPNEMEGESGGELDSEFSNALSGQEALKGNLYQLNVSYGINYKAFKKLHFGLNVGYAFDLQNKSKAQDLSTIIRTAEIEQQRLRPFIRPNLNLNFGSRWNLNLAYQWHADPLFNYQDEQRSYQYLSLGASIRLN